MFLPNLVPVPQLRPGGLRGPADEHRRRLHRQGPASTCPRTIPSTASSPSSTSYAFHYMAPDRWELADHLDGITQIRARWLDESHRPVRLRPDLLRRIRQPLPSASPISTRRRTKCLLVLANADYNKDVEVVAQLQTLREKSGCFAREGKLVYATYEMPRDFNQFTPEGRRLGPHGTRRGQGHRTLIPFLSTKNTTLSDRVFLIR
ncbi:MAG: hypothetical protein MZU97_06715 [Bacillus subtilis]|nr:hypothetical protein [Bacillus subtilis]